MILTQLFKKVILDERSKCRLTTKQNKNVPGGIFAYRDILYIVSRMVTNVVLLNRKKKKIGVTILTATTKNRF